MTDASDNHTASSSSTSSGSGSSGAGGSDAGGRDAGGSGGGDGAGPGQQGEVPRPAMATWKLHARGVLAQRLTDYAGRLRGHGHWGNVFVNEDLPLQLRRRKATILKDEGFRRQKTQLVQAGKLIRWRQGLPFWQDKGATYGPLTPLDVSRAHLPQVGDLPS